MNLSLTQAWVNLTQANNGSLSQAFQFGKAGDTSWNFTGCTFKAEFKASTDDVTPLLTLTSAGGSIVVDDAIQRVLHFNLSPTSLKAALPVGEYVYDLVMTDGAGVVTPLMAGCFNLVQGVTED